MKMMYATGYGGGKSAREPRQRPVTQGVTASGQVS